MRIPRVVPAFIPLLAAGLGGACARHAPPPAAPLPPALPELSFPLPQPTAAPRLAPQAGDDALAGRPPGNPITLSARNVDLRVLLPAIAEEAGVSLVIDPAIEGRITVNFTAVPARDALRAVLAAAGLGLGAGPPIVPVGPTVFYAAPIDLDRASAELIEERFRVSPEMARWIVANRPRR